MANLQITAIHSKHTVSFLAEELTPALNLSGIYVGNVNALAVSGQIKHRKGSSSLEGQLKTADESFFVSFRGELTQDNRFIGTIENKKNGAVANVSGFLSDKEIVITGEDLTIRITKTGGK